MSLRILIVGNFLSHTGGSRGVCEDLALRLQTVGHQVITTSRYRNRPMRLADMLSTTWRKRKHYDVAQVDVYSGPAFFWAEAVCHVLRRAGKPYLLILHGGNLPTFARRWPDRVRRLLQSAAVVTAPSRYLLEEMRAYRTDMELLPNPIDLGAYSYKCRQTVEPGIVWLRAFHAIYNPQLLARVVAELIQDFPSIQVTMIGPDKGDGSFQATQQLLEELGIADRFRFPGGVAKADVPKHLNSGDIFINTTNVDNTPVSVIEAMACGLCVVSTNVGGIPYLLDHEQDALLVPPNDPDAMADAVRRILAEPDLAAQLSRNARRKAEQFDWKTILPQWERLLTEVAQRG